MNPSAWCVNVMAYEVVFSASAQRDRDRVVDYLINNLKSHQAAAHFLDELDGVLGLLEEAPDAFPTSKEPAAASDGVP